VIGVDVGGTNVRTAVVDRKMSLLAEAQRPIDKSSPSALLEGIADCVREVMPSSTAVAGIGVAMKGYVDHLRGVMVGSGNLGMRDLFVKSFLEERFGLYVSVDNDVHAATIGEIYYGVGRRYKNFIYINVGTGIAAGMVFDGKLYRGASNLSGEFGHTTVDRHGWACCGIRGCLEKIVSGPGIVEQVSRKIKNHENSPLASMVQSGTLTATDVFHMAEKNDDLAVAVFDETVAHLGTGIINLINLLNPEAVILGGGVFSNADLFVGRLVDFVKAHAIKRAIGDLQAFGPSALAVNKAGLIGAAGLIWERRELEGEKD
jgi:glucokinase